MLRLIRPLTLKDKLVALTLGISSAVLLLSALAFFVFEYHSSRLQERNKLSVLARAIAINCAAPLMFKDRNAAGEVLNAFSGDLQVTSAVLLDSSAKQIASYRRESNLGPKTRLGWLARRLIGEEEIVIEQSVDLEGETLGNLEVHRELKDIEDTLNQVMLTLTLVSVVGGLVAYLFSSRLQIAISGPLVRLKEIARKVSTEGDYSLRVTHEGGDEIGELVDGFNRMLSEIELRDRGLQTAREELEMRVRERTGELRAEVAERKRAEEALRREEEQLRMVFKSAPAAIAMVDTQMRYLAYSDQWLKDYGLEGQDLIGRSHYEVFPTIPERWKEIHIRVMNGATESAAEDSFKDADGKVVRLRWTMLPWYRSDGKQGGALMSTALINELVDAREAALQAVKLRSEFIANVSHELRTPLNGIIGFTDLLLDGSVKPDDQRSYLETVKSSSLMLLELINEILDFSKIEAGKMQLEKVEFSPVEVVKTALQTLKASASLKGLYLELGRHAGVPAWALGDGHKIRQVLINLTGNAIKFTDKGGITINIEYIAGQPGNQKIQFSVCDTGLGVPKDKQRTIFEAFTQADGSTTRKYGGTGLGLTICSNLTRMMGGEIWVESEPGQGSQFFFNVVVEPVHKPETQILIDEHAIPGNLLAPSGGRILVVEDNAVNRKLIATMLGKKGFEVTLACNGKEAVQRCAQEEFDLVLMDLQMPEMGGIEATQQIRALQVKSSAAPIVALTAHAMSEDERHCLDAGMNGFLSKPIDRNKLFQVINQLLRQR